MAIPEESNADRYGAAARKGLSERDDLELSRRWLALKYDSGYSGINWPRQFGGVGLSALHQAIFAEEELPFGFPTQYFRSASDSRCRSWHYAPAAAGYASCAQARIAATSMAERLSKTCFRLNGALTIHQ
jgi:hypothetical protein